MIVADRLSLADRHPNLLGARSEARCEVGPQRRACLSTGPFLRSASRTRRARFLVYSEFGVTGLCRVQGVRATIEAVTPLGGPQAWREITAERMLLHVLQGHCNSPIAGYATSEAGGGLSLRARVFSPDGKRVLETYKSDIDPTTLGTSAALSLLRQGARELIDAIPH